MKRLIPAGVLAVFIVVICVLSNITVTRTIKKFENKIEKCENLYEVGQYEQATKTAEDFKSKWKKVSKVVSVYSNHCPLDDISMFASVLPEAINEKNDFEFKSTVNQIKTALSTIKGEQTLTLESLY